MIFLIEIVGGFQVIECNYLIWNLVRVMGCMFRVCKEEVMIV